MHPTCFKTYWFVLVALSFAAFPAKGQFDSLTMAYELEADEDKKYELLWEISNADVSANEWVQMEPYNAKLMEEAAQRRDTIALMRSLAYCGILEFDAAQLEATKAYYERGLEIARKANNKKWIIIFMGSLADTYIYSGGDVHKFHELIITARDSLKMIHSPSFFANLAQTLTTYYFHVAYDFDESLKQAQKGMEIVKLNKIKRFEPNLATWLCRIYAELEQFDSAEVYCDQVLALEKDRYEVQHVLALCVKSQIHLMNGRIELATNLAEDARIEAEALNSFDAIEESRNALAKGYLALGQKGKARRLLLKYFDEPHEHYNATRYSLKALNTLVELEREGNPALALKYFERAFALRDTLKQIAYSHELAIVEVGVHLSEKENDNRRLRMEKESQEYEVRALKQGILVTVLIIVFLSLAGFYIYKVAQKSKRLADELSRSNQLLELQSEQLQTANKDLEIFSYSLAHDIKGYVNQALNYTFFLDEKPRSLSPEQEMDFMEKARHSIKMLHTFCGDLIGYARMSKDNAAPIEVDLNGVMAEVRSALQLKAELAGAELRFPHNFPEVFAHRSRMVQLFQNLIDNAIKYHRPGVPPVVDVSYKKREGQYIFTISDNGTGIPEDRSGRLFELFVKGSTGGSGIGLAVCKRIVEQYGGSIWVESGEEREGSRFHFTIPA